MNLYFIDFLICVTRSGFRFVCKKGPVTKVKALMGWDNKGTLQHMAKMSYMTERADRMDGLGVSTSVCLTLVRDLPNALSWNASCCRVRGGGVRRAGLCGGQY